MIDEDHYRDERHRCDKPGQRAYVNGRPVRTHQEWWIKVSNFPPRWSDAQILKLFVEHGGVSKIKIVPDPKDVNGRAAHVEPKNRWGMPEISAKLNGLVVEEMR